MGYRLIDTAAAYGNEEAVGRAIQVETYPFQQQVEAQQFMRENNVRIESWGPFAEGKNNIFQNEVLLSVANKYGKSVAQVILRWLTQREVAAIPKSVRKERIIENFNIFDFELSAEDMAAVATLDTKQSLFFDHRDPKMVKMLGEAEADRPRPNRAQSSVPSARTGDGLPPRVPALEAR